MTANQRLHLELRCHCGRLLARAIDSVWSLHVIRHHAVHFEGAAEDRLLPEGPLDPEDLIVVEARRMHPPLWPELNPYGGDVPKRSDAVVLICPRHRGDAKRQSFPVDELEREARTARPFARRLSANPIR